MNINSLEEAVVATILEFEYDHSSPLLPTLAEVILWHIDRMDQNPDAIALVTEKDGAREYVRLKGKDALIEEVMLSTGILDKEEAFCQFAEQCCRSLFQRLALQKNRTLVRKCTENSKN